MATKTYSQTLVQLEDTLEEYLVKKAPGLPMNIKEILVAFAPFIVIISLLFFLPSLFLLFGLGGMMSMFSPYGGMYRMSMMSAAWFGMLVMLPAVVLEVMAIPGLFARAKKGWQYLFWAQLITVAASIVQGNLVGALVGGLIGLYLLFQVRSLYK